MNAPRDQNRPDDLLAGPADQPWPTPTAWLRWRQHIGCHEKQWAWIGSGKAAHHFCEVSQDGILRSRCGRSPWDQEGNEKGVLSASFLTPEAPSRGRRGSWKCKFCVRKVGDNTDGYAHGELTPPTALLSLLVNPDRDVRSQGRELLLIHNQDLQHTLFISPYVYTALAYMVLDDWDGDCKYGFDDDERRGWLYIAQRITQAQPYQGHHDYARRCGLEIQVSHIVRTKAGCRKDRSVIWLRAGGQERLLLPPSVAEITRTVGGGR